jgi:hypothetical protein
LSGQPRIPRRPSGSAPSRTTIFPTSGNTDYKKCPRDAGGENKTDRLSVIALSFLPERLFEDDYTAFYEIYGTEQCKNRDYQKCEVQDCLQHGHGDAPIIFTPNFDVAAFE